MVMVIEIGSVRGTGNESAKGIGIGIGTEIVVDHPPTITIRIRIHIRVIEGVMAVAREVVGEEVRLDREDREDKEAREGQGEVPRLRGRGRGLRRRRGL